MRHGYHSSFSTIERAAFLFFDNAGISCSSYTHCDICGAKGRLLYGELKDNLFNAPGIWNLLRCTDPLCGMVWCDPMPRPDQIEKLYTDYFTHTGAAPRNENYKSKGASRLVKALLANILRWRSDAYRSDNLHLQGMRPGTLLEIGCGSGDFLAAASRDGWNAHGIDFDPYAIEAAKTISGISARVGELITCAYSAQSFDAIVMNNVIEHLWNPGESLTECFRILRSPGRLVVVTPNTDSTGHKAFGRDWRGLEPPRHLFLYNKTSILRLAKNAGFSNLLAFSSSGGSTGLQMFHSSTAISCKSGRRPTISPSEFPSVIRRETISSLLGKMTGEWLVLIAKK
jgi:2-polyprenyl-3-methyl-5-hydroxy-6-metoxy-1,4-benzoquinol methylase